MHDRLMELLDAKYQQMMQQRGNQPLRMPTRPWPVPTARQIAPG
jgi:hypothetical protein